MTVVFIRRGRETRTQVWTKGCVRGYLRSDHVQAKEMSPGEIKPVNLDHRLPASRTV